MYPLNHTTTKSNRVVSSFAFLAVSTMLLMAPGLGEAATATASVGVSATVATSCKIQQQADVAFGTYDPTDTTPVQVNNGRIRVRCTRSATPYAIYMGAGTGSGAACTGTPVRKMTLGTDTLNYALYQGGYTTVWGCEASNDYEYTATNNGWTNIDIYGQVPAEQDVPAGAYADTVTVTVNF